MPQMSSLDNVNKTNDLVDRNHFSEHFDSIIDGLKSHATVMGPVVYLPKRSRSQPTIVAPLL